MYKPSLRPLSKVKNHKIKSIKLNELANVPSENIVDKLKLEKIIEYDEDLMQLNDQVIEDNLVTAQTKNDLVLQQLKGDLITEQTKKDLVIEKLEDDLIIDEQVDLEKRQKIYENSITVEENNTEFVDQFKSTKLNEDEINLVPRPSKKEEEVFNKEYLNNELSNLDKKDKNLLDNKMFYKELFRIIEKGKNLEKISKSKDYTNYLDTLKSENNCNKKNSEKRIEDKVYTLNNEIIKIDKIVDSDNYECKLDQNNEDNLDGKNIKTETFTELNQINLFEKIDDSNQLIENEKNDTIDQIDNSNQMDSNQANENTTFNTTNVAIATLTGLLSAFFYYYNNFS